jgi:hypothetical protein
MVRDAASPLLTMRIGVETSLSFAKCDEGEAVGAGNGAKIRS